MNDHASQLRQLADIIGGEIAMDLKMAADQIYEQRVELIRLRSLLVDMAKWTVKSLDAAGLSWDDPDDVMLQDVIRAIR